MKNICLLLLSTLMMLPAYGKKQFTITSPNGQLSTQIDVDKQLTYSIDLQGKPILDATPISIDFNNGKAWSTLSALTSSSRSSVNQMLPSPFYRASEVQDNYNQLTLKFKNQVNVEFRAYNEGVAYRLVYTGKKPATINNEEVVYHFPSHPVSTERFVNTGHDGLSHSQLFNPLEIV